VDMNGLIVQLGLGLAVVSVEVNIMSSWEK